MAYAAGGRVSLVDRGEYNSSTTYHRLDYVKHNSEIYICKQTSLNNEPDGDDAYWTLLVHTHLEISDSEWAQIQSILS